MTQQENIISAQIDDGLHEKQTLLDDFAKVAMQAMLKAMQRLSSVYIEMTYTTQFDGKTHQLITRSMIKEVDNG